MKKKDGVYHYRGHTIERGAYQGTPDDRLDRWYIDADHGDVVDRRGPGFRTIREAQDHIDWHIAMEF